jgi:hypothetical protein
MGFIIFLGTIVLWNWFAGTPVAWASGSAKGGDLLQHYIAGQMWNKGQIHEIYHDYHVGDKISEWLKSNHLLKNAWLERFNYVYNPLFAWLGNKCSLIPYTTWIQIWFYGSILLFIYCIEFYFKHLINHPFHMCHLFMALGFPPFYYTLISSQTSIITLALILYAAILIENHHPIRAGLFLSLIFYKPQCVAFLFIFLTFCQLWEICLGLGLGSIILLTLSTLICGIQTQIDWIQSMLSMLHGNQFIKQGLDQSWIAFYQNIHLPPSMAKLLGLITNLAIIAGVITILWKHFIYQKKWRKIDTLFVISATWPCCANYIGYYDLLLVLPLALQLLVQIEKTDTKFFSAIALWILSLISIAGTAGIPIPTAPLLTLWLFTTLFYLKQELSQSSGQKCMTH